MSANSKSFQRRTNNGYTGNGEISILTGEDRKTSPRPLIESIISGGGKITSWRQSGKIRSWPRQKLFSRIKAVARQIQDTLQIKPGDVVGLCFQNLDIDHVVTLLGCFMAGVNPINIPTPENSPQGVKFQLSTIGVKFIFASTQIYKLSQKKEEKEQFQLWSGMKVVVPSKSVPNQKWRCDPMRSDKSHLLIIKEEKNQVVIIKISQATLANQLTSLAESLDISSSDRVMSLESNSNSYIIYGILLPFYIGCDTFLLPPQITKQSPEVWSRIVERHKITCLISRAREFSWATQIQGCDILLKCLENIVLLDGRQMTSLSYAQSASLALAERLELDPRCVKSLITSDLGGAIGYIDLISREANLVVSRDSIQNGHVRFGQKPTLDSIEIPAHMNLLNEVQLIIVEENEADKNHVTPLDQSSVGQIFVKSDFFKNSVFGLENLTKFIFGREIEGVPGTWVNTGLTGAIVPDNTINQSESTQPDVQPIKVSKLIILGQSEEVIPISSLGEADVNLDIYRWDILSTILSIDQSLMIFQQRCHVFSVNVAGQPRLVITAELKKMFPEPELTGLINDLVDSIIRFHHVGPFVVSFHSQFQLPSYPDGRMNLDEIEEKFKKSELDSIYVLTLPWKNFESSLPKAIAPGCVVGAAGMVCGSVISGTELAYTKGNPLPEVNQMTLAQRLAKQSQAATKESEPIVIVETIKDLKVNRNQKITIPEIHKNANRIALLLEKNHVAHGDLVLVNYDCPIKIISAVYGCWYRGAVPIPIKASPDNSLLECISQSVKIQFVLSGAKKSIQTLIPKSVPIIEIDNPHKMDSISFQSLSRVPYQPPTLELRCLVDAYISPVGGLIARQFSWKNILSIGQSLKDQMEVYPGREIDIALDFTYGTGLFILSILTVYTGCTIVVHHVNDIEMKTPEFLNISLPNLRDIFVSASIARIISQLKLGQVNNMKFKSTRSFNVVYQNVSPCTVVMTRLSQLLESCGLQTRSISVSCSFQSVPLITLRSGIAKNIKSTYIDLTALRSGRIKFSQKGAKYSALIHEAGALMPGSEVVISDVSNNGQCGMGRLGEVWIRCDWSCSNYLCSYGGSPQLPLDDLQKSTKAKLMVGNDKGDWCRTGMLGFLNESENDVSLFVIGNMIEHISHRGFKYHPDFLEQTVNKVHSSISNCCIVSVQGEIICMVESTLSTPKCLVLSSNITSSLADNHHLIASVVVVLTPRTLPMSTQGNPQRQRAAEMLLQEKFKPILISYNS